MTIKQNYASFVSKLPINQSKKIFLISNWFWVIGGLVGGFIMSYSAARWGPFWFYIPVNFYTVIIAIGIIFVGPKLFKREKTKKIVQGIGNSPYYILYRDIFAFYKLYVCRSMVK